MNLRDLIRTQKGQRTYRELERDCGGQPSHARLQQLATQKQKNFPDPDTVRALARGLRVAEVTVVLAAAEDLGIDVSRATPRVLDFLPPGVNDLSDRQLHAIAEMIRAFIEGQKEQAREQDLREVILGVTGDARALGLNVSEFGAMFGFNYDEAAAAIEARGLGAVRQEWQDHMNSLEPSEGEFDELASRRSGRESERADETIAGPPPPLNVAADETDEPTVKQQLDTETDKNPGR